MPRAVARHFYGTMLIRQGHVGQCYGSCGVGGMTLPSTVFLRVNHNTYTVHSRQRAHATLRQTVENERLN